MSEPLITIGITCYKEGDWLQECWESVLAQTDERWEAVLIMDGGADEKTREVFAQLEHPKLRKYCMPCNMGPYPTRNKAFELTETPYHFYLDGDDQLLPESVSLVLETFQSHPEVGFVYGDYEFFGSQNNITRYPEDVTAEMLIEGQCTPGPCAYKKALWEQLGGFSLELARGNGDYDFLIGAWEAGAKGKHCEQVIYRYRVGHASKISSSYGPRYHETHEIMVKRHPGFFSNSHLRRRFLALGYKRAARANLNAGQVDQATRLAWAALRHGVWRDFEVWFPALRLPLLPSYLYNPLRRTWRWMRGVGIDEESP